MLFLPLTFTPPKEIRFAVGNDRRAPYHFRVINRGWNERDDDVTLEAFLGKTLVATAFWKKGLPNVYAAKARRQGRSGDTLITATCDGNQTQYTGVWLFSAKSRRFKWLATLDNADDSRLSWGILKEENVDRWIGLPSRDESPSGWYHRTWMYNRKAQCLTPGRWRPGMLRR